MAKSIRDEKCRKALLERIEKLTPDSKAVWGKMSIEQMLSHLVHAGDLPFAETVPDVSNFFSRRLLKPLMLHLLPMPKEIKTTPEMDQQQSGRRPLGFDIDKVNLVDSINRLATLPEDHPCLGHPFFGKMSTKEWGMISHKHIDHHLRQFGA